MKIGLIGNETQREELLGKSSPEGISLEWKGRPEDLQPCDAVVDLLFQNSPARIAALKGLAPLVLINSVVETLSQTDTSFVRINGWRGFLGSPLLEAAGAPDARPEAERVLSHLGKEVEWLPDHAGFVTPRVVSTIINEAYFALEEGVSTAEEIDTAMKLGTNYPYGPLEWGGKIGLTSITALLLQLAQSHPRYQPCDLLLQKANRG